jgi:thioesterase domain-containing protein
VPVGIPGEVHIGGAGVTNGYLNRPELTAQRFLSDPFACVPGARMYRTGDIARWLPDGSVDYLGRADRQVKIRGIRIEPGDIETALIAHKAVRQAALVARTETPGDQRLAAYLVAEDGAERPGLAELRAHVAAQLPNYMVPNAFVWVDALPLTPSGKIDRKALPTPDMRAGPQPEEGFVPPTGECEEKLAAIWRDLLGIERIGATDDFFALGGHSLLVLPMRVRIETVFGRRLAISAIFYGPTIRLIAALLSEEAGTALPTVSFQANGRRPPLFWIDPGPIMTPLAQALGPDQPFLGLMFNTVVTDDANQPNRIADIAPYLVESLRRAQPCGPYYIGGWCADGLLAFDIASRLLAEGETVGLLVLLHAGNPVHFRRHGKAAVKFSSFKHQLRLLGRMRHKELRDFAAERAKRLLARISPKADETAPTGHYFDGIIDRTAMHYEPKPYAGDAVLFQPIDRPQVFDHRAGWAEIVQGEFSDFDIPGGHHTMLYEPNVQELAARLAECLERAQAKHGNATA